MKKIIKFCICLCLLTSIISCSSNNENELHIYNWTYFMPDEIVEKFYKETGITVIQDYYSSNEEMFAKLKAGGGKGFDIVFPSADYTSIMIKEGMLQKLNHDKMPNLKYITPIIKEKAVYDPLMEYAVPYFIGAAGIAVNTEKVNFEYERSWDIFSDKRLKGKMTLLDDMREVMGDALITLGYSNNTSDINEINEAAEKIKNSWLNNIVKFDAESFAKSFALGEFYVVHSYSDGIYSEVNQDKWDTIDFFFPEEGGSMYVDNMVVLKDAPNYDAAIEFINFIHRPDIYAIFLDEFLYPPTTNTGASEYMQTTPHYTDKDIKNYEILNDLGQDLGKYNKAWEPIRYSN